MVIPKEIRRTMRIREGDPLEIYTTKDGEVIFKKYSLLGGLEDFAAQFCDTLSHSTEFTAAVTDRDAIIAVAEKGKPFNRYYIGSGEPKPLREFLLEMRDLVDPAAEIGLGDLPFKGVNVSYDQFDLKKVERDTGYVNQIPFAQGIKMTADYIREEA